MENKIIHTGVLGMRWGRRKARLPSEDHINTRSLKKKKLYELSNDELKKFNQRKILENQFKSLNPSSVDKGKKVIGDTMKGLGWVVTTAATMKTAYEIGKTVYEHLPKQSMMMHP